MAKNKQKKSHKDELKEVESSYQQFVKGKYKGNKESKKFAVVGFIVSAVAVILVACSVLFYYNYWLRNTQINNVSIGGISLKGLNVDDAADLLNQHQDELLPKNDIIVKILDDTFVLPIDRSNARLDTGAIANAAYVYGRNSDDGDVLLELDPQDFIAVDSASIRAWLKENIQDYNGIPVETTVEVTGDRPDLTKKPQKNESNQVLTITLGTPKHYCSPEPLFQSILNAYKNRTYEIIADVILVEPAVITAEGLSRNNEYYVKPVDATLDPETFIITECIYGYGFDIESLQAKLDAAQWGETITVTLGRIAPKVTSDTINAELYKDVLATYTTKASSQANRNTNLSLACKAINGIILYPGQTFSYNQTLGKRTAAKGYKEANTYYNGEVVESLGGGICQVSSTLYWCAMHADLQIVERANHSLPVSYIPKGMDATVSWGGPDLKFKNDSDYPIKIVATSNKGNVTVRILGTDYKDYYVKIKGQTVKTTAYSTVTEKYPIDNEFGYVNGQVITKGRTGYVYNTYRYKYDKATNKEIAGSRVLESVTTIKKADKVVASVPTPPAPPAPTVPDGGTTDGTAPDSGTPT